MMARFILGCVQLTVDKKDLTRPAIRRCLSSRLGMALAFGLVGAIAYTSEPAVAQITPDATLGTESSVITPNANVRGFPADLIEGGATRGVNLFHSFSEFNIDDQQRVYFANPEGIENILTRVTGDTLSNLSGTLGVDGRANLFLLNPNGIRFGANAFLDVGGSFVASTASAVTFPNGIKFSATNPQAPPLLTINVPLGLQFRRNPGSIGVERSFLQVPDGQTLALVGGEVSLDGAFLDAPGGRVELGAVAGTGTVRLNGEGSSLSLNFPQGVALTDVSLTNGAIAFVEAGGGGSIAINAFDFNMAGVSGLLAGIGSGLGSADSIAGNIDINATGAINLTDGSAIINSVLDGAQGQGGDINITTGQLRLFDGSYVSTFTLGDGNGGNLTVNASNSVQLIGTSVDGLGSRLFTFTDDAASANAGDMTINTGSLLVRDGAFIRASTFGEGNAGNLTVNASQDVQLIGTSTDSGGSGLSTQTNRESSGKGGDLTINTGSLLVRDGASITAFTNGEGDSGNLTINASQDIQLIGTSTDGRLGSILSVGAVEGSSGKAGDLTINTATLLVRDGAFVSAFTVGERDGANLTVNASQDVQLIGTSADGRLSSGLSTSAIEGSSGKAGDLTINTATLLLQDGATVNASTFGTGKGGNLTVNASQEVQLLGESPNGQTSSSLASEAFGTGAAGNVSITTGRFMATDGAYASSSTYGAGRGGALTVNASELVELIGKGRFSSGLYSGLYTEAGTSSTGDSGDLIVNTPALLVQDGAAVNANTGGAGKGGNLTVNASEVQLIGESTDGLSASRLTSEAFGTGAAGNVSITTGRFIATGGAYASTYTYDAGQGGEVTLNASEFVELIGSSLFPSGIYAGTEGLGDSGNLTVNTPVLLVRDGATVFTNTGSEGDAGDLTINTGTLLARDGGFVSASTFGAGNGGDLTVNASHSVQLIGHSADGVPSALGAGAGEGSSGDAGDVTINTGSLLVRDGALISARTQSSGIGGSLTINASDSVQLSGVDSGLLVNATAGGTAGNLTVETRQMSVSDGAQVTVSSPQGQAGNLIVQANSLLLNHGNISAETAKSGAQGGANITLTGLDFLRLDNESLISANARDQAKGGNVTIDSTFIVATPPTGSQGSDITANALEGNGGQVSITTQGLFGIEFRPALTPDNDITVTSQFGLAGDFEQNTPGVDPTRGLAELPTDVVDASRQIDRRCTPGKVADNSRFTVTGRGGLPASPNDTLQGEAIVTNWVTLDSEVENHTPAASTTPSRSTQRPLVEAQGWVTNEKGEVVLTEQAPTVTPHESGFQSLQCNAPAAENPAL